MICAVKVIDREGRGYSCFNTHLTSTRGKVRPLRSFWFTAGVVPQFKVN